MFTFAGGAVSWQSKLYKCVALSITEAEYIAAIEATKEMLWMKRFLLKLIRVKQDEYVVFCDSQSSMDLSKNATYRSWTKYIDVRYHWLCEVIDKKQVKLAKIHTEKNPSNMLTKVVLTGKLELCSQLTGLDFQ